MKERIESIESNGNHNRAERLLVFMTNQYISYRNSCYESVVNMGTNIVEDQEDIDYINTMDEQITEVIEYLED